MRIGIDVRYLSHGLVGGVHTYVAHFVPALIDLARDHHIYLYADTKRPFELADLPAHVTVRYLTWKQPVSSVYHDFFMRRQMARDGVEIAHFPANYGFGPRGARTIVTLHDALTIMPLRSTLHSSGTPMTLRRRAMIVYLYLCSQIALRQASLVVTVSQHARREIARYSRFDPNRIVSVPHAPTPDLQRVEDSTRLAEVRRRHHLDKPFVLADALKNPGVLVRAWPSLPETLRQRYEIVFFSRRPDPLPIVQTAVAAGHARLLINPPREDLIALYSLAEIFVFPSWIEGFGIPLLEAMTCGAPVIASNRSAIPEVVGDAGLIIDAEDDVALAQHLTRLLSMPAEAQAWRERGFRRAAQFSWRHTAQRILDTYSLALNANGSIESKGNRTQTPAPTCDVCRRGVNVDEH
ncbi:MAG TPA: glycosyltransferase family 1 protein [Anaerolineae bacterium]|nr:glycosyltransferase family 1 protein [Anaerolineae bacterium]